MPLIYTNTVMTEKKTRKGIQSTRKKIQILIKNIKSLYNKSVKYKRKKLKNEIEDRLFMYIDWENQYF